MNIVDTLDGEPHYSSETIQGLLSTHRTELNRTTQFVGRPGTRIHARDGLILKLRGEISLKPEFGERWIALALNRERLVGVHHPHKTWILLPQEDGAVSPGNITPELRPLHTALAASSDQDWCLEQLTAVVALYADIASQHDLRLDEGLSNFGLDTEGRLFYLDDEIYRWDRFISFCSGLGVYIRSLDMLDRKMGDAFGQRIAEIWKARHPDPQVAPMLARMVRDLPLVGDAQITAREALADALHNASAKERKTSLAPSKAIKSGGRLALLADVHANAPALAEALDAVKALDVTSTIMLGDVVGYGPHPRECIAMLRTADIPVIKGNHDHAAATGFTARGFNWAASWVIDWTREALSDAELDWLATLPDCIERDDWFAVHGAPMDPNYFYGYVYRMTASNNLDYMARRGMTLCLHGHSHMVGVHYRDTAGRDRFNDQDQNLGDYHSCLVCPGSVGKPRCGVPGSEIAVLDLDTGALEFHRIDYNMAETVHDMKRNDFPDLLIERLEKGN